MTDSKEVLILINGHNKARALAATVEGGVKPEVDLLHPSDAQRRHHRLRRGGLRRADRGYLQVFSGHRKESAALRADRIRQPPLKQRQRTYVLCHFLYSAIPLHIRPSKGKGSPHLRYRPQTMKNGHEWWKYVYDEFYNCVICPEYQPLKYSTTNRDGYRGIQERSEYLRRLSDQRTVYAFQGLYQNGAAAYLEGL